MAKTSSRSFSQYSGIDRQNQMQSLPSATDRLGDPAATQAVRDVAPWALGLAERGATPSGRSTRDPYRALEMLSRGTARPGQVQAAMGLRQLQQQDQDPIDAAREQQFVGDVFQPLNPQPIGFAPQAKPQYSNLFRGNNQTPSMSATRRGIGGALRGGFGGVGNGLTLQRGF